MPEDSPGTVVDIGTTTGSIRTHRFALSICGGVALGAYEAGVVSQLYRDIYDFNQNASLAGKAKLAMDAISGASAGSITGLILAQGIGLNLTPDDMERLLRLCWVELLDIKELLAPSPPGEVDVRSVFSDQVVTQIINKTLSIPPDPPGASVEPLALWLTMTNLDGVPFVINFDRPEHAQPGPQLYALDYKDFVPFLITGEQIKMVSPRMIPDANEPAASAQWKLAANAARASSAFPVTFPPAYQSRDLTHYPDFMAFREAVEKDRVADNSKPDPTGPRSPEALPTTGTFQFADGGLFSNQPIGRCIDAVAYLNNLYPERDPNAPESSGMVGRSFIVIDPVPQTPRDVEAALRDIINHENDASLPTAIVGKILGAYFNTAVYADFRNAAELNVTIRNMRTELAKLDLLGLPLEKLNEIKQGILKAAGLADKNDVTLQRIPSSTAPNRKLAGEFDGHFGGFFRSDYRAADFITGRSEARSWLSEWLSLWLKDHAADIGITPGEVTEAYVASLLKSPPPDPAEEPILPTELTPNQFGTSNWFPKVDTDGRVSYVDRMAALNTMQRQEIVDLAESRILVLLESWFHVPAGKANVISFLINHFVGPKFVDEPTGEK